MAYKLSKKPTAWWPVVMKVSVDGGQVEEQRFELRYVRLGRAEFNELWRANTEGHTSEQVRDHNRKLFDASVVAWRGLEDEHGTPARFEGELIDQLLDEPGFPEAFSLSYLSFWSALPEMIQGNSAPSPAGGPQASDGADMATTATSPKTSNSGEPAPTT